MLCSVNGQRGDKAQNYGGDFHDEAGESQKSGDNARMENLTSRGGALLS